MIAIPLNRQGQFVAIVDPEDADLVLAHKWTRAKIGGIYYATKSTDHCVLMHRLIMSRVHDIDGFDCDHVNRDGLDNRRENLRVATRSQNCMNREGVVGATSRFKGVSWDSGKARWRATIKVFRRYRHIGRYRDEIQAARAYDEAAHAAYGDFAHLNFPTGTNPL